MDLKTKVVQLLATGSTPKLAAGAVGITESDLAALRDGDEPFNRACVMARSNLLASCAERLAKAKDWRAAKALLASQPETRDEYSERQGDGPKLEVVIHVQRDADEAVRAMIGPNSYVVLDPPPQVERTLDHETLSNSENSEVHDVDDNANNDLNGGCSENSEPPSVVEIEAEERNALEKRLRQEYENEPVPFEGSIT